MDAVIAAGGGNDGGPPEPDLPEIDAHMTLFPPGTLIRQLRDFVDALWRTRDDAQP